MVYPDTTYTTELTYIGIMCPCPQWASEENISIFNEHSSSIPMDSIFYTLHAENENQVWPFDLKSWKDGKRHDETFI